MHICALWEKPEFPETWGQHANSAPLCCPKMILALNFALLMAAATMFFCKGQMQVQLR